MNWLQCAPSIVRSYLPFGAPMCIRHCVFTYVIRLYHMSIEAGMQLAAGGGHCAGAKRAGSSGWHARCGCGVPAAAGQ